MARRLQNQKRSEYQCPPKAVPQPADMARFPELRREIVNEWRNRMVYCRSGQASRRRADAKRVWVGLARAGKAE